MQVVTLVLIKTYFCGSFFSVAVHFDQEVYTVEECQGVLEVCLSSNTSVFTCDISVSVHTQDFTALGEPTEIVRQCYTL